MSATTPISNRNNDTGIMESIAALREVLMLDTPTKAMLSGEKQNSIAYQFRSPSRHQYEEEIGRLKSSLADMQKKQKQLERETEKERCVHKTLETSYDMLSVHKKELTAQLDQVSEARESLEEKVANASILLGKETKLRSEDRQKWETEFEELKKQQEEKVASLKKEWSEEKATLAKARIELESKLETIQADNRAAVERAKKLQEHLVTSQGQVEEQSGQIESLTTKLDSTKMELKEMDDKVVAAKVSWDNTEVDLRSQLAEMASAKMDSIEELKRVTAELKTTRLELEEMKQKKEEPTTNSGDQDIPSDTTPGSMEEPEEMKQKQEEATTSSGDQDIPSDTTPGSMEDPEEMKQKQEEPTMGSGDQQVPPAITTGSTPLDTLQAMIEQYISNVADGDGGSKLEAVIKEVDTLVKTVKTDYDKLEAEKTDLELTVERFNDKASVDLATSREKWRRACDDLHEAQETLEEKNSQIMELQETVAQLSRKEELEVGLSEEDSYEEDENPDSKRQRVESDDEEEEENVKRQRSEGFLI